MAVLTSPENFRAYGSERIKNATLSQRLKVTQFYHFFQIRQYQQNKGP